MANTHKKFPVEVAGFGRPSNMTTAGLTLTEPPSEECDTDPGDPIESAGQQSTEY